jgi:hypothetical protein
MIFDGKEQGVVKFVIGGPSSQIVFEAEGSEFYVSGYNPPAKTERENLFTAIIAAPVIELNDWKNEKIKT